jgi:hypothetical protein
MLLYYPLSALLTLFATTIQNPQNPQVSADLEMMEVVISYFSEPVIHVNHVTATTARIFEELVNVAKKYVEKTNLQASKPTKRGHDEGDSEQDISDLPPEDVSPDESLEGSSINFETPGPVVRLSMIYAVFLFLCRDSLPYILRNLHSLIPYVF